MALSANTLLKFLSKRHVHVLFWHHYPSKGCDTSDFFMLQCVQEVHNVPSTSLEFTIANFLVKQTNNDNMQESIFQVCTFRILPALTLWSRNVWVSDHEKPCWDSMTRQMCSSLGRCFCPLILLIASRIQVTIFGSSWPLPASPACWDDPCLSAREREGILAQLLVSKCPGTIKDIANKKERRCTRFQVSSTRRHPSNRQSLVYTFLTPGQQILGSNTRLMSKQQSNPSQEVIWEEKRTFSAERVLPASSRRPTPYGPHIKLQK